MAGTPASTAGRKGIINMIFSWLPESVKKPIRRMPVIYKVYLALMRWLLPLIRKDYKSWMKESEPLLWSPKCSDESIQFSLIVPVYNTVPHMLKACVGSVIAQEYSNWELILVNDGSTKTHTLDALGEIESLDSRIKVIHLETNQHISLASNVGIDAAVGGYVGFLDHDDRLAAQALNEMAVKILEQPEVKWLYSDEDFINQSGQRIAPHFKTDWNLFLLRSHNYITHFCVYQTALLKRLGGFRKGFEGAQDYDLALRASEVLDKHEIAHVAKVLYHWRIHKESSSSGNEAKPYTVAVGKQALTEYFSRCKVHANVLEGNRHNYYQVQYIPTVWPKVSIIIPTRDQFDVLKLCVESILNKTNYPDYEIIVMDNQTVCADAKRYLSELNQLHNIQVVPYDHAFNYSDINNQALPYCHGEMLVLLNNDTQIISADWLSKMVGLAALPEVGCVGAKLLYPDQTIQHAGVVLGLGGYAAHSHRCMNNTDPGYFNRPHVTQTVSAVTGACLAIKKSLYEFVGGLDVEFTVAYNDVDFCLRVQQAGYDNVYCADAELYHFESKTRGDDQQNVEKAQRFEEEKKRLKERWFTIIEDDPFYSPHLTRDREDFSLKS